MPTIHHEDASEIRVESDECGFELHITDGEGVHVFNIHSLAVDLLAAVERTIAPWHREGMTVLAEMRAAGAFHCDPDESCGYDISDPKHPDFHSVHADIWDNRDKTA